MEARSRRSPAAYSCTDRLPMTRSPASWVSWVISSAWMPAAMEASSGLAESAVKGRTATRGTAREAPRRCSPSPAAATATAPASAAAARRRDRSARDRGRGARRAVGASPSRRASRRPWSGPTTSVASRGRRAGSRSSIRATSSASAGHSGTTEPRRRPRLQALAALRQGHAAVEHLVEHHPEGEHVGPLVLGPAAPLLGRHVGRRPAQRPLPAEGVGHAEVEHLDQPVVAEEDVGRLEVAVDDAVGVRVGHAAGHVQADAQRLAPPGSAPPQPLPQRAPRSSSSTR